MSIKIIQTIAVLGLASLAIACTLTHCWWAGVSLSLSAAYIGMQDDDEDEMDEMDEEDE